MLDGRIVCRCAQHRKRLLDETAALGRIHRECGVLRRREAPADTDFQPSGAQQVEGGDALGDMHWMMEGQWYDAQSEPQARCPLRQGREHEIGFREVRVTAHQMVLDQPHAVKSEPVGELDFRKGIAVGLRRCGWRVSSRYCRARQ